MQAADVQNLVERTGQGGKVGDACNKKIDRKSAPGRFGASGEDRFGYEIDARDPPSVPGQGDGIGTSTASQIQRFSGRGPGDEFHHLGRGDLSVPRCLPEPIAPLEFPAVGQERPDPFMPHVRKPRPLFQKLSTLPRAARDPSRVAPIEKGEPPRGGSSPLLSRFPPFRPRDQDGPHVGDVSSSGRPSPRGTPGRPGPPRSATRSPPAYPGRCSVP